MLFGFSFFLFSAEARTQGLVHARWASTLPLIHMPSPGPFLYREEGLCLVVRPAHKGSSWRRQVYAGSALGIGLVAHVLSLPAHRSALEPDLVLSPGSWGNLGPPLVLPVQGAH